MKIPNLHLLEAQLPSKFQRHVGFSLDACIYKISCSLFGAAVRSDIVDAKDLYEECDFLMRARTGRYIGLPPIPPSV